MFIIYLYIKFHVSSTTINQKAKYTLHTPTLLFYIQEAKMAKHAYFF
jgi:hypothetical protein